VGKPRSNEKRPDVATDPAELIRAVHAAAQRVTDAESDLSAARRDYWKALSNAHKGGVSLATLGRELGVTRQRIKRIIDGE
jgi:hypothetical protein